LKGQAPPPYHPRGSSQGFAANGFSAGATSFHFNPRNAEDIFAEFFGSASPFGGMGGIGGRGSRGGGFGEGMSQSRLEERDQSDLPRERE